MVSIDTKDPRISGNRHRKNMDRQPARSIMNPPTSGLFVPGRVLSSGQIVESSGFGKDKVLRVLRRLSGKNLVRVQGSGRATRYIRP